MRRLLSICLAASLTASVAWAAPTPECQLRILHPAVDDLGTRWEPGKLVPVTIMRRTGRALAFCAHGGSCIPRLSGGVQVARLANCRPGAAIGGGDYRLDPDPAAMGARGAQRFSERQAVGDKLAALGFSNAAVGSWANDYAADSKSANGRLVARALGGSADAVATMKEKLP